MDYQTMHGSTASEKYINDIKPGQSEAADNYTLPSDTLRGALPVIAGHQS
jgi:hypothetical protein